MKEFVETCKITLKEYISLKHKEEHLATTKQELLDYQRLTISVLEVIIEKYIELGCPKIRGVKIHDLEVKTKDDFYIKYSELDQTINVYSNIKPSFKL